MSKPLRRREYTAEFAATLDSGELVSVRPADEVLYGRLWAEVELPRLLAEKELGRSASDRKREQPASRHLVKSLERSSKQPT